MHEKLLHEKRFSIKHRRPLNTHTLTPLIYYCVFVTRGQHKQLYVLEHVDKAATAHWRLMDGRVCRC